jgi:hypothetical protein
MCEPGVEVIKFPAVDGARIKDLDDVYDDNAARFLLGRSMTRPEIGCALSHASVIEDAEDFSGDFIVVLEDDTRLDVTVSQLKEIPSIYLDSPTLTELVTNPGFTLPSHKLQVTGDLSQRVRYVKKTLSVPTSTRCYILNRAAIKELSQVKSKVYFVADFPPHYVERIQFWYTDTPIARDLEVESIVGSRPLVRGGMNEVFRQLYVLLTAPVKLRGKLKLSNVFKFIAFRRVAAITYRLNFLRPKSRKR